MCINTLLGPIFRLPGPDRRRRLYGLGTALIITFLILRGTCDYGDPKPWEGESGSRLYAASERVFTGMLALYERTLQVALHHRFFTLMTFVATVVLTGHGSDAKSSITEQPHELPAMMLKP